MCIHRKISVFQLRKNKNSVGWVYCFKYWHFSNFKIITLPTLLLIFALRVNTLNWWLYNGRIQGFTKTVMVVNCLELVQHVTFFTLLNSSSGPAAWWYLIVLAVIHFLPWFYISFLCFHSIVVGVRVGKWSIF